MRAFVPMIHTGSGRGLLVPLSAVPYLASRPDVSVYQPASLHGSHGHIHADWPLGKSVRTDQPSGKCHHTHAPGCRLYDPQDESILHSLAVTILESDLFARLREAGSLSGHDVPRQAPAGTRRAL